ncbi:MAG: ATP-grasp domain-containing protein [Acidimicrobiia bacterium]|nr:ATP-grasp domain-containing protein [Acidimicrobiia bacterium]
MDQPSQSGGAGPVGVGGGAVRAGITAVGSGIGQSVVDACRLAKGRIEIIGFDANPFAYGAADCDGFATVPLSADERYVDVLVDKAVEHGLDILVPGLDDDLLVFAAARQRFEAKGVEVLVAPERAVQLTRDKLEWSRALHPLSEIIVAGYTAAEAAALVASGDLDLPLLAKPSGGSGSAGVQVITDAAVLSSVDAGQVVQPLLLPSSSDPDARVVANAVAAGRLVQRAEVSYQLLLGADGEVLGRMATRNRLKDGIPIEIVEIDDQPWWDALQPVLAHLRDLGVTGPVNFQGRMTEQGPRVFEMNLRYTGITGLRSLLGFNEVEVGIAAALGHTPPPIPRGRGRQRVGVRQVAARVRPAPAKADGTPPPSTVLVTGATGWLGRHLVARLDADPQVARVVALVRSPERADECQFSEDVELLTVADWTGTDGERLDEVDAVVHAAADRDPSDPTGKADDLSLLRTLLRSALAYQVPRFVYLSSQSVYGTSRPTPWSEDLAPAPETVYGLSKLAGEELVELANATNNGTAAVSLRLAKLYGAMEGLRWTELVHRFALQAATQEPIRIVGGDQAFDLLHLEDALEAIALAVLPGRRPLRGAYNVGSGTATSILEVADAALAAVGGDHSSGRTLEPATDTPLVFQMDVTRFRAATGWVPTRSLADDMEHLVRLADRSGRSA